MITLCKIDGTSWDDLVTAIQETPTVNEGANSGIALHRDREIRDITGIKIGHSITFDTDKDVERFDALYNYLFGAVRPSVMLEVVHNQKTITYEAAYNTGSRHVAHINDDTDTVYWSELTVDFRPIENQINAE
jgi:hypothetical protein